MTERYFIFYNIKKFGDKTLLELKNITKNYYVGDETVEALKGVDIKFRESDFVSILGPSGCGKTTLLNIIGGLDHYTSGDLIINGVSTKEYKDKDWDTYRNHSIGFVFQSYNLIPHQTVLENVELALTLSGVSKKERRERAKEALIKVGLKDKLKSKPNQLSGGQMQRVAIARALVNDPDILLADEPTGALDSTTSVQIMDLLAEIAKDRLIIMVTHNPSLAEEYSTRIIRILDGLITDDTKPLTEEELSLIESEKNQEKPCEIIDNTSVEEHIYARKVVKKNRTSMSFFTALSLSFKNLMTKKGRTFLTSFAGSIGIIGIALVLAISSGFQAYIDRVQKDTLSNYPITITSKTTDVESMLTSMMGTKDDLEEYPDDEFITGSTSFTDIIKTRNEATISNNLKAFKSYLEGEDTKIDSSKVSAIKYGYDLDFDVYLDGQQINAFSSYSNVFGEMIDNTEFIKSQYDLIGKNSRWNDPNDPSEAILVVNKYNQISDIDLLNLGIKNKDSYNLAYQLIKSSYKDMTLDDIKNEIKKDAPEMVKAMIDAMDDVEKIYKFSVMMSFGFTEADITKGPVTFDDLFNKTFTILPYGERFYVDDGVYNQGDIIKTYKTKEISEKIKNDQLNTFKINIVGIARLKEDVSNGSINATLAYSKAFTDKLISIGEDNQFVKAQIFAGNNYNVFSPDGSGTFTYIVDDYVDGVKEEVKIIDTVDGNLKKLGYADLDSPTSISIYPVSFEDKDYIEQYVKNYNAGVENEDDKITYNDYLGLMMSSISTIIDAISYVLIGFVSVSLVVSSIMIGIITYISVLERIKEIGILRAVGASKKDISRVFNAETLIIGFVSGIIGIGATLLLTIPINLILSALAGIKNVASLPVAGAFILVGISMLLTFIAGLVPSRIAAKKDPVEALRSE